MNIKPLGSNVIITKIDNELKTESGIVLTRSDSADKAKVHAIGPDVQDVQVGDTLLVNWNKAPQIKENYYKINVEDIIAVFED